MSILPLFLLTYSTAGWWDEQRVLSSKLLMITAIGEDSTFSESSIFSPSFHASQNLAMQAVRRKWSKYTDAKYAKSKLHP